MAESDIQAGTCTKKIIMSNTFMLKMFTGNLYDIKIKSIQSTNV